MSDHLQYLSERDRIDFLIEKGYEITNVQENLNGALVEFSHNDKMETLQIGTANARKYFSSLVVQQKFAKNNLLNISNIVN